MELNAGGGGDRVVAKRPHAKSNRCGAKTRSGEPCKNGAMANGRCRMHGGKSTGPPKKNQNAKKHGFFQKHMPEEAYGIMNELLEKNPIDMLWENIVIQYTAIIRAQRIMYVRDQDDTTTTQIEERQGDSSWGQKWEVQHAWDKQATFLQAQSRAMSTLQSLIKQYDELLKTELATEEQRVRIAVLKSKVPNQDPTNLNAQITALADLINNPAPDRVIDDD